MPELYGNPYLLPAIIVVVLLLLLLLVRILRRRRTGLPAETRSAEQVAPKQPVAPGPGPTLTEIPAAPTDAGPTPTAAVASAATAADVSAQAPAAPAPADTAAADAVAAFAAAPAAVPARPAVATAAPAATPAEPEQTGATEPPSTAAAAALRGGAVFLDDPLRAVIMDILQGWGELTGEDVKRLEVFRSEKILEATDRIVLPRDHKLGEHARVRLAAIRDTALNIQLKAKQTEAKTPEPDEAATPPQAPEAAAPTQPLEAAADTSPATLEVNTGRPQAGALGVGAAAGLSELAAGVGAAKPAEEAPVEQPTPSTQFAIPERPVPSRPRPLSERPTPWPPERPEPAKPSTPSDAWSPRGPGQVAAEPKAEAPARMPTEAPAEPKAEAPARMPTEAPAAPPRAQPGTPTTPPSSQAPDRESVSGLRPEVKTAADLFALPAGQRSEMLVFLEPTQLARVFEATNNLELKKGVIDTLEHVGNPSALAVLRRCLEDPDPKIQLYALEAADRLLGAD